MEAQRCGSYLLKARTGFHSFEATLFLPLEDKTYISLTLYMYNTLNIYKDRQTDRQNLYLNTKYLHFNI